jgi:hydroxymethylbilane synthase
VSSVLKIGTRGSELARWQTDWVRERLARHAVQTEVVVITTQGDADVDRPLHELEGTGFFTKGIEDALLDGRVDIAVHSLKDLPTTFAPGLALGAVPERADPRDVLVVRDGRVNSIAQLQSGARVGTSSLRRVAQLRYLRGDLEVLPLRGNVPTRVKKVKQGSDLDAALLACAGLERLGLSDAIAVRLDPLEVMPAPGQGALGIEIRLGDSRAAAALRPLDHRETARQVEAERRVLAALGGGCQAPVAAYVDNGKGEGGRGNGRLYGRVTAPDGSIQITASAVFDSDDPGATGVAVADLLRAQGALELLAR